MAIDKKTGEHYDFEGKYKVKEAKDVEITSLDEESSYLGAAAKSVKDHISKIVAKLKAVDQANAENRAYPIKAEDARTLLDNENDDGLSSAITLANSLKSTLNDHYADAGDGGLNSAIALANALKTTFNTHVDDAGSSGEEHTAELADGNIDAADATDLTSLITLTTELLSTYDAHDADAEAATPTVHQSQEAGDASLSDATAPTDVHECITRLNDLKAKLNTHVADDTAHTAGDSGTESTADAAYVEEHIAADTAVSTADATDLTTLIALTTALLTSYDSHDADAEAADSWTYHIAQEAGDASLADATAPTTLAEAIVDLNDLKAKLNTHVADDTAHVDGDSSTESNSDAANGAAVTIDVTGAALNDQVMWSIIDNGSNNVVGVSAVAGSGNITFTFDGDPGGDTIVSYVVIRPAS